MALISIIIPAYNAERSLGRTVRSVLEQTLKDIEVWIVDDGSTDGTPELADRLAIEDSRVRVLHQTNQRAYAARINALKHITAPYFAFVDADDTLEPHMYERMLQFAEQHDLDVVQCEPVGQVRVREPDLYLSHEDVVRSYAIPTLIEGRVASYVWDKIYKRHLAAYEFEASSIFMFDDLKINLQIFNRVNRLGLLHEGLYHYDVNMGSSVRNFRRRNVDDLQEIIATRARWASSYGVDADDPCLSRWIVKNARNFIVSACAARAESLGVRLENVRAILGLKEVQLSIEKLKDNRAEGLRLLRYCQTLPLPLVVLVIRLLKKLKS